MEERDDLKEILNNINQINESIDLEDSIMLSIRKQEIIKNKILTYRRNGIRGLLFSFILVVSIVLIYSFSIGFQTFEGAIIKYSSLVICLIVLFAQLEMGGIQFINQFKNKSL